MKAQRLRFRYRVALEASVLSQRELVGAWENAAKAAGLPLAYSEGKRPAAQISVAAPLPLNVTSDSERVDVFFGERVDPGEARALITPQLPPGIELMAAEEVGVGGPSLQSQLRWAEYEVEVPAGSVSAEGLRRAIADLLRADTLPSEYRRESKVRLYDLRPLILDLRLQERRDDALVLCMRLRAEPEMTGRADQVLLALGIAQAGRIHRRRLYLEEAQAAVLAYRRLGEPEEG
ncbi:MAG: TIGR03936 family radical SAM-associated protein [Dehalococcoidia bacterium]|nr:TIGR03936 family radical SAM-associated protein [Dehalococcoidia bacterium]